MRSFEVLKQIRECFKGRIQLCTSATVSRAIDYTEDAAAGVCELVDFGIASLAGHLGSSAISALTTLVRGRWSLPIIKGSAIATAIVAVRVVVVVKMLLVLLLIYSSAIKMTLSVYYRSLLRNFCFRCYYKVSAVRNSSRNSAYMLLVRLLLIELLVITTILLTLMILLLMLILLYCSTVVLYCTTTVYISSSVGVFVQVVVKILLNCCSRGRYISGKHPNCPQY